jgi:hypothetical protein
LKEARIQAVGEDRIFSDLVEALLREYLEKKKGRVNLNQTGLEGVRINHNHPRRRANHGWSKSITPAPRRQTNNPTTKQCLWPGDTTRLKNSQWNFEQY